MKPRPNAYDSVLVEEFMLEKVEASDGRSFFSSLLKAGNFKLSDFRLVSGDIVDVVGRSADGFGCSSNSKVKKSAREVADGDGACVDIGPQVFDARAVLYHDILAWVLGLPIYM